MANRTRIVVASNTGFMGFDLGTLLTHGHNGPFLPQMFLGGAMSHRPMQGATPQRSEHGDHNPERQAARVSSNRRLLRCPPLIELQGLSVQFGEREILRVLPLPCADARLGCSARTARANPR